MAEAVQFGRYLIDHARQAILTMSADVEVEDARRLLRWVQTRDVATFTQLVKSVVAWTM